MDNIANKTLCLNESKELKVREDRGANRKGNLSPLVASVDGQREIFRRLGRLLAKKP